MCINVCLFFQVMTIDAETVSVRKVVAQLVVIAVVMVTEDPYNVKDVTVL